MNQRTRALAAAVLIALPLVASCTRTPRNPTQTTRPGGGGGNDCGTVVIGEPVGSQLTCFLQYHTFNARKVTTVERVGDTTVTIVYEASAGHDLTLTKTVTDTASGQEISTQTKRCEGFGAQIIFDRAGRPGAGSNCTI